MNKFWLNYVVTFALVTALLVMPWTTSHIHLEDHHQHESLSHQHQTKAHTHSLVDQYVAPIDFSHNENHEYASDRSIVELVHEASLSNIKQHKKPLLAIANSNFKSPEFFVFARTEILVTLKPVLGSLYYLPFNPRAPPQIS